MVRYGNDAGIPGCGSQYSRHNLYGRSSAMRCNRSLLYVQRSNLIYVIINNQIKCIIYIIWIMIWSLRRDYALALKRLSITSAFHFIPFICLGCSQLQIGSQSSKIMFVQAFQIVSTFNAAFQSISMLPPLAGRTIEAWNSMHGQWHCIGILFYELILKHWVHECLITSSRPFNCYYNFK